MSNDRDYSMPDQADSKRFNIRFPKGAHHEFDQDEEYFEFEHNGQTKRMRIHDYPGLYNIQGLYEALVYEALGCQSPERIIELFFSVLHDWPIEDKELSVLDLGAGNGIIGDLLKHHGANKVVGLDLLPEAKLGAERDRPGVYEDYVVADLTELSDTDEERLEDHELNCLVTVAALGFGDIPPRAFANAFNLISERGWLAMTIKENFLQRKDTSGFSRLVRAMIADGIIEPQAHHRYCHRKSVTGDQLFYIALVARKMEHIPAEMIEMAEAEDDGLMPSIEVGDATAPALIGK